jgi:uncharacterized protein with ParB-like and HNH nuclease domain
MSAWTPTENDSEDDSNMEMSKKAWPVSYLNGIRTTINTNPDYQRPAVWSSAQKQLLVDSILRGYDVPKFYLR